MIASARRLYFRALTKAAEIGGPNYSPYGPSPAAPKPPSPPKPDLGHEPGVQVNMTRPSPTPRPPVQPQVQPVAPPIPPMPGPSGNAATRTASGALPVGQGTSDVGVGSGASPVFSPPKPPSVAPGGSAGNLVAQGEQMMQAAAAPGADKGWQGIQQAATQTAQNMPMDQLKSGVNDALQGWYSNIVGGPMQQVAQQIIQSGQVPPDVIKANAEKLRQQNPENFQSILAGMGAGEHLALWGGLGLGVVGLLSAMSGGGLMSWLAALMGLGTAGFAAGQGGLLGQGAQNFTGGLASAVTGQPRKPQPGSATSAAGGAGVAGGLSPSQLNSAIQLVHRAGPGGAPIVNQLLSDWERASPDMAAQLDQAIGHGGFLNQVRSRAGQALGWTPQRLTEYGIAPENHEPLLNIWRNYRNQGQPPVGR